MTTTIATLLAAITLMVLAVPTTLLLLAPTPLPLLALKSDLLRTVVLVSTTAKRLAQSL